MVELEELLGTYHIFTKRTRVEARTYTLKITPKTTDSAEISLELAISGRFGSLGQEWKGICYLKNGKLIFECKEQIDWRYTFLDEERNDMVEQRDDIFSAEISQEGDNVLLNLSLEVNTILLCKSHEKISQMTYWITREIISHHELDEKADSVKPDFWMISNLILKDYKEIPHEGNNAIEVIIEYDLDLVKKEKQVVDDDEIGREHHVDRAFFDNHYKISEYESNFNKFHRKKDNNLSINF